MTTIITKNGSGAPTAGQLSQGELAVDLTNKELYTKDSGGNVIKVGAQGGSTGTFTDLTATSSFTSPGIDDNATSTAITIDANENVGIGETNPESELHISSASPDLILEDSDTGSAIGSSNRVRFRNSTGTYSGQIGNDPAIDGGQNFTMGTLINYPVGIMTNGSTKMLVDGTGNVGIGSNDPESLLTLQGNSPAITVNATNNDKPRIELARDASVNNWRMVNDSAVLKHEFGDDSTSWTETYRATTGKSHAWNDDQMVLTQAGNVGIGTDAPGVQLDVLGSGSSGGDGIRVRSELGSTARYYLNNGDTQWDMRTVSTDNALVFAKNSATGTDERMRIDSDGNVGIGTDAPASLLNIEAPNSGVETQVIVSAISDRGLALGTHNPSTRGDQAAVIAAQDVTGQLHFRTGGNTDANTQMVIDSAGDINVGLNVGTPTGGVVVAGNQQGPVLSIGGTNSGVTTGDSIGSMAFITADPSFTNTYADGIGAEIAAITETGVGGGYGLAFTTGVTTGSNRAERLRIAYDGNVGIGTEAPSQILEIRDQAPRLRITDTDLAGTSGIEFADSAGTLDVEIEVGNSSQYFAVKTAGSEAMRLDNAGNLLVGMTSDSLGTGTALMANGQIKSLPTYSQVVSAGLRDLQINGTGIMGYSTSTRDTKEDIAPLSDVSWLFDLQPVSYSYIDDPAKETQYGLIYDEVEPVNADLCFQNEVDGELVPAGVTYSKLVTPMLKALQEQQAMIETLQAEVAALKGA